MKKKQMLVCLLVAGIACTPSFAAPTEGSTGESMVSAPDNKVLKGNVADSEGPLMGATVKVAGTAMGTVTDMDGNFTIQCAPGATLEISYIGYEAKSVKAKDGMKIVLSADGKVLNEVVVTALGIKRDRKALGYGLAEVKGEELTKAKETNVVNSLAGKVAGLVVQQTAGGASGSTKVQLRGATEMTGNNQPLYVIDGVPLDNTNFASADGNGGYDLGDGISAINPDDIETMSVLKGPAASALYGSRASHGVILITTKKAGNKESFSVEYNGSHTFDIQAANWDNIQQVYGQGNNGHYLTSRRDATNMSWGPKADNFNYTFEFDGKEHPYKIVPNNADGFFRTGMTTQNTAILSASSGKTGMRFSFTDMRNQDILPNSRMSRDNFNLRVNTSAGKFDFDFIANYTTESVKNRPALASSTNNVGKNLMTLATTFDQAWLKHYQNEDGSYADWNGMQIYNVNPYWDLYKNSNNSRKDVYRFTAKAIYNATKHLKIQATVGADMNNMDFAEYIAKTSPQEQKGKMTQQVFNNRTYNAEILGLYNNTFGDFDLNATLGANMYKVDNKSHIMIGKEEIFDGVKTISNYAEQSAQETSYRKQINSVFASASLGYLHTYFLEATIRGDQSSTLPVDNNKYLYPSLSGSLVWSEYLKDKSVISYGKVRASWAEVGSDTDPYLLSLNYTNAKFAYPGYITGMVNGTVVPNKDLKPTRTRSYEIGLETKFFHNRIGLDITYYNQTSRDQIIQLANSSAASYEKSLVNAGKIQNKGIEIALNARALQLGDFAWDLGVNFSKNSNKVLELANGMDYFEIEKAPWMSVSVGAEVGQNFGSIKGKDFKRTEDGKIIVNESGLPMYDDQLKTIGNASWDWTGGFYHTFSYKNFRLSAAFDVKVGADVFSMSMSDACYTGKDIRTLAGRDEWYRSEEARIMAGMSLADWRASGQCEGFIVDGVVDNGDGTYRKNDYPIDPQTYWNGVRENVAAMFVYDNSYVKCREITFGYTFPAKILGKHINGLSISFVARNPFIIWKNIPNIDPDSNYSSRGMGLEYGSLPSRRSYGFNINLKF